MSYRLGEIILHIVFWTLSAWLLTESFSVQMHTVEIENGVETVNSMHSNGLRLQIISCIVIGAFLFYTTAWLLLRKNEIRRKTVLSVLFVFGAGIALAWLAAAFRYLPEHPLLPKTIAFGIVAFYAAVSIAYSLARLWYRNQQRQQQLLLDKKQTELSLLRNQLQPHFLFNALNNLLSMVKPGDNPKLADSFERLSQLLRYVIEETQSDKVGIQKEIAFLKNYIELQLLRFNENEVQVNFTVEGKFTEQKVEPGLFIAFVENAFKYGTEPERSSAIAIHFDLRRENTIYFSIKNTVLMQRAPGSGTGIESARKRLELIYPGRHRLEIQHADAFQVSLTIQTQ